MVKPMMGLIPRAFEELGYWAREDDSLVAVGYKDEGNELAAFPLSEHTLDDALDVIVRHFIRTAASTAALLAGQPLA